jgi:hypothetical protein
MKAVQISLALLLASTSAAAQTSAPGVCFAFETTGAPNATLPLIFTHKSRATCGCGL